MQTIVELPEDLYRRAESTASREGIPVDVLIAKALQVALGQSAPASGQRITFPLHHSSRPGTLTVEQIAAAEDGMNHDEDAARAGTM